MLILKRVNLAIETETFNTASSPWEFSYKPQRVKSLARSKKFTNIFICEAHLDTDVPSSVGNVKG